MPPDEQSKQATLDQVRPIPPRYWWLKRILVAVGVLIVALAGLRWWWGWYADRKLQAKIAECRAAGQPVTVEDFQIPAVPDEENAAHYLTKAAGALVFPADCRIDPDYFDYDSEFVAEHLDEIGRFFDANKEVVRLARLARSKSDIDWEVRLTSPVMNVLFPGIAPQKRLGRFLRTAALYRHHCGADGEALELAGDALGVGERLSDMGGLMINHIASLAASGLAIDAIEEIAPALKVGSARRVSESGDGHASRQQVETLIRHLLADEPYRRQWRRAVYGERLIWLDTGELIATGRAATVGLGNPANSGHIAFLFGPMMRLDALRVAELITPAADAREAPDWPSAAEKMPPYPGSGSGLKRFARSLSSVCYVPDHALVLSYRALALRRMAATALAIRLYELEHGRRPESLAELVPEYLPHVPPDPFAKDGRALGYRPDDARPRLYSVGRNGIDERGEYGLTDRGGVDCDVMDIPYFLNGDRPRPKRDTGETPDAFLPEAIDDDQHIDDEHRQGVQEQGTEHNP